MVLIENPFSSPFSMLYTSAASLGDRKSDRFFFGGGRGGIIIGVKGEINLL